MENRPKILTITGDSEYTKEDKKITIKDNVNKTRGNW